MFKTPADFAAQLVDNFFGNTDDALVELFEAPKVYPQVPNRFWKDVYAEIVKLAGN